MNLKATIALLTLATALGAAAQETNGTGRPDYAAFRVIALQNIFNQYRTARRRDNGKTGQTTPAETGEAFMLVGTMSYTKGYFSFFDGTSSEFRKVLRLDGTIGGYKVTGITQKGVTLNNGGREIEMKVGMQMRRDLEGAWQLTAGSELPGQTAVEAATNAAEPVAGNSGGDANDVLNKLMQQREQELK